VFVAYLSKFSPISPDPMVKKPGMTQWMPLGTPGANLVLDVKCPQGANGKAAVEVFPK
jgi:hypothetical protein